MLLAVEEVEGLRWEDSAERRDSGRMAVSAHSGAGVGAEKAAERLHACQKLFQHTVMKL